MAHQAVSWLPDRNFWEVSCLRGAIAQLGERLLCKQEVEGSRPSGSTKSAISEVFKPFVTIDRKIVCVYQC